jgi:hypothetical protein
MRRNGFIIIIYFFFPFILLSEHQTKPGIIESHLHTYSKEKKSRKEKVYTFAYQKKKYEKELKRVWFCSASAHIKDTKLNI